ncbi:MAG: NAD(+) synthase [bacterium]
MAASGIKLREIEPAVARWQIEDFIVRKVVDAGMTGGVVGLSGGIDSSTVAFLAASAFKRHAAEKPAAGRLELLGLILPSATNSPQDEADARDVAGRLGIECITVGIQPLIDTFARVIPAALGNRYHVGNLSSELRAVVLSRHAAARRRLILGTGNRDEDYCLGYFTKRGDGAVDISPIGSLSKRNVRILAAHMGVPERIITKAPAAGLWHGQTDEGELGFTYEFAERVIAGHDSGLTRDAIASELGCSSEAVGKVMARYNANKHKMEMPEIAPVTFVG